ncbi:pyridoxal 5'-phosphate synthase [Streptomyces sp. NPDC059477]|uniref:pyridoxal 5'-phosphate synthase n=1 Tax=Streptomyces sp. NPDC059477 TaxID=3346847 RepID=UPI0036B88CD3
MWDPKLTTLPPFTPDTAPAAPLPLFATWFAEAVGAGQPEPHTLSLATVDDRGRPDVRTVMLHGVDEDGWSFATHSTSRKGQDLAVTPYAALGFYWPVLGRQVRVRGPVTQASPKESRSDLDVRSTGALAAALTGHQSEVLPSLAELERRSEESWALAESSPAAPAPTWTLYRLRPDEVEFFQGDAARRHVRLRYRRERGTQRDGEPGESWSRQLLWP